MTNKTPEQLEEERLDDHNKRNHAVMEAQAKQKPTPSVHEVQQALEGKNVDHKEDHGAPEQHTHAKPAKVAHDEKPEPVAKTKASEPEPHATAHEGNYKTRAATAKKD